MTTTAAAGDLTAPPASTGTRITGGAVLDPDTLAFAPARDVVIDDGRLGWGGVIRGRGPQCVGWQRRAGEGHRRGRQRCRGRW